SRALLTGHTVPQASTTTASSTSPRVLRFGSATTSVMPTLPSATKSHARICANCLPAWQPRRLVQCKTGRAALTPVCRTSGDRPAEGGAKPAPECKWRQPRGGSPLGAACAATPITQGRREQMLTRTDSPLVFPVPEPPRPGETVEIAPGILWARIPLPFRLDHINVYLIEDG